MVDQRTDCLLGWPWGWAVLDSKRPAGIEPPYIANFIGHRWKFSERIASREISEGIRHRFVWNLFEQFESISLSTLARLAFI